MPAGSVRYFCCISVCLCAYYSAAQAIVVHGQQLLVSDLLTVILEYIE